MTSDFTPSRAACYSGRVTQTTAAHGTANGYAGGCRCRPCRGAWREYMRDRRARLSPKRERPRRPVPEKRDFSYYRGKTPMPVSVTLTPLARQIMEAAKARTARSGSDVVEHLLRLYGGEVTFDEARQDGTAAA